GGAGASAGCGGGAGGVAATDVTTAGVAARPSVATRRSASSSGPATSHATHDAQVPGAASIPATTQLAAATATAGTSAITRRAGDMFPVAITRRCRGKPRSTRSGCWDTGADALHAGAQREAPAGGRHEGPPAASSAERPREVGRRLRTTVRRLALPSLLHGDAG